MLRIFRPLLALSNCFFACLDCFEIFWILPLLQLLSEESSSSASQLMSNMLGQITLLPWLLSDACSRPLLLTMLLKLVSDIPAVVAVCIDLADDGGEIAFFDFHDDGGEDSAIDPLPTLLKDCSRCENPRGRLSIVVSIHLE